MRVRNGMVSGIVTGLLLISGGAPLAGQHPVEGTEYTITPLRTHGQPVLPVFEGWYKNQDGTYNLCFGYYNLNTEQPIDVPLGPDNFIEPREYDGGQPTHFEVQQLPELIRGWCTFTVRVPADIGAQRVVWTLKANGTQLSIPGHIGATHYGIDEPDAPARDRYAPRLRFEPSGPEGRGRNGFTAGPLSARVGRPLPLDIRVTDVNGNAVDLGVTWLKHQGPGTVTFSERITKLRVPPAEGAEPARRSRREDTRRITTDGRITTTATFDTPGRYLLLVQAVDDVIEDFEFHCCWTNAYVTVDVQP